MPPPPNTIYLNNKKAVNYEYIRSPHFEYHDSPLNRFAFTIQGCCSSNISVISSTLTTLFFSILLAGSDTTSGLQYSVTLVLLQYFSTEKILILNMT